MIIAAFDIETIPSQELPAGLKPEFDPETVKYGNTKDLIKRQIKKDSERLAFESKLDKKMSTDPGLCQVCTFVGMKYDTEERKILKTVSIQWGIDDNDELDVVHHGWEFIQSCYLNRHPIVTYNGIGFDLPVMIIAALRQDVVVSSLMYNALRVKWEGNIHHYDLMLMLSGWEKTRWKKMDFWLRLLGIGQKTEGMDGSEVYPAFQAEEFKKIQSYCEDDVRSTCELMARVQPYFAPKGDMPEEKKEF
jgi:predicted PolB exonuclease-like 3'-5' exonuclease